MAAITQYQPYGLPGQRRSFVAKTAATLVAIHILSTGVITPNHASDSGDNLLVAGDIEVQGQGYFGGASNYAKMDSSGLTLNTSDTVNPTVDFKTTNTAHEMKLFLDESSVNDELKLAGQTASKNTTFSIQALDGENAVLYLVSGNKFGYINYDSTDRLFIVNNKQDENILFQINDGGVIKTITWDAANDKLLHSAGKFTFDDDVALANAEFLVFDKASGNGIKVDTTTPTFGFADLLGDQFSKNTGATKPTLVAYNGAVDAWQFSNGDEAFLSYHIPHDYVPSTDIHLHVHWSQNNTGATGGTIDFKYFAIYSKGHNQASGSTFTSTPITVTFSSIDINDGGSGLSQYQQHFTEVTISAASATVALFDRDDFEPDGVIELTLEMDANNLTGTPSDPFIHYVDIHYQTTGIIGTKSRTPDFYT